MRRMYGLSAERNALMEIRKLKQEEKKETRTLYEEVFSEDSHSFVDYYYSEKTKDNVIYVGVEDGKICSMLHRNPYLLMVNGNEKKSDYIVAVATRKDYRKRGYMSRILHRALADMYSEGYSFTFLMPAAEAIYEPHGFRTVYEQEQPYGSMEQGAIAATEADCKEIADFMEQRLSEKYQVYAKRTEAYYVRLLRELKSDGGNLLLYRLNGRITDCRICVPEPEEEKAKIMIRIVDVRRMLMSMKVKSLIAVCFTVTDPLIPGNNRCLVLTGTEFSGVMLMDAEPKNSEGTVDIASLARLLFGACGVEALCENEDVSMSERMKQELKKIIPLSEIYLNEIV